jgi:hypothetical protein
MTKLDAVNEVLARVGIRPVPALDTGGAGDAAEAERCIDREELNTQSLDWHYNRRREVELFPVLFTFDNAAWTAATKTLTQTGKFADASSGQTITITAGATTGDYIVDSITSADAVVLKTSISVGDVASGVVGKAKTNAILVPAEAISADSSCVDDSRDITKRGRRLLDLDDNTDQFSDSVTIDYIERVPFNCIPQEVQALIVGRASLALAEMRRADQYPAINRSIPRLVSIAKTADARKRNRAFFDRADSLRNRRRLGNWATIEFVRRY